MFYTAAQQCPYGFIRLPDLGSCVWLNTAQLSFDAAQAACAKSGASLSHFRNQADLSAVNAYITSLGAGGKLRHF